MRPWPHGRTWEKFERITAAIQQLKDEGAEVRWNERTRGRQVDVTVRFTVEGQSYLLLIECKNFRDAVSVGAVDAFATKSKRLGADRKVLVSANGFQRGAIEEAKHHGIVLFTLTEIEQQWPQQYVTTESKAVQFTDVRVSPASGILLPTFLNLPELLSELRFELAAYGYKSELSLGEVVARSNKLPNPLVEPLIIEINFKKECLVHHSSLGRTPVAIHRLELTATPVLVRKRSRAIPPDVPMLSYEYGDISSGDAERFDGASLHLSPQGSFEQGKFYRNIFGLQYKCEHVDSKEARMFLISNQHGKEFAVRFRCSIEFAPLYAEVTSKNELEELSKRYGRHVRTDA